MTDPYSPLVQDLVPLNEVKYAARDYPSMFDALLRRLKVEYATVYNDYATTTQGVMLLELMAYAMSQLQWYLDRTASDCFLDTARTRAAIARLVKQIGYKMGAAAAASATLELTFEDGTAAGFIMPARWQFQGPDGLVYESYSEYTQPGVLAPGATIEVPVRQGETRLLTYTSDGTKNQKYRMSSISTDRYLGSETTNVWVDGALWDESEFLEFEKTNHYEVGYNDDPPTIQFGDDIAGNAPAVGAEVKIQFIITDGELGNVKEDTITSSIDTLYIAGSAVTFTVTNEIGANGGLGPEDPERARRLAPFAFAARGAAITEQDYEALSNSYTDSSYGSVAKAYAFNPRTAYSDVIFNGYINDIESELTNYVNGGGVYSGMIALEAALNVLALSLTADITGITEDNTNLETLRVDLQTQVGTAVTDSTSALGSATTAEAAATLSVSNCANADTGLDSLQAYIDTILTGAELTNVTNRINSIKQDVTIASSNAFDAQTESASAAIVLAGSINNFLNPAYTSITVVATAPAFSLPSIIADTAADLVTMTATVSGTGGIQDSISDMVGEAQTLQTEILLILPYMHTRIGDLFDADCMSNYVQVPILSVDTEGWYVAPSVGLIKGLQSYLTGIKEVTQDVEVIDGSPTLVEADIEMVLDVNKDAADETEVVSNVVATVVGMLKGRDFNQPLNLDLLYKNTKNSATGINKINIEIVGPIQVPSVIDSNGNLVPESNRIITWGSLSIVDKNGVTLYTG